MNTKAIVDLFENAGVEIQESTARKIKVLVENDDPLATLMDEPEVTEGDEDNLPPMEDDDDDVPPSDDDDPSDTADVAGDLEDLISDLEQIQATIAGDDGDGAPPPPSDDAPPSDGDNAPPSDDSDDDDIDALLDDADGDYGDGNDGSAEDDDEFSDLDLDSDNDGDIDVTDLEGLEDKVNDLAREIDALKTGGSDEEEGGDNPDGY